MVTGVSSVCGEPVSPAGGPPPDEDTLPYSGQHADRRAQMSLDVEGDRLSEVDDPLLEQDLQLSGDEYGSHL